MSFGKRRDSAHASAVSRVSAINIEAPPVPTLPTSQPLSLYQQSLSILVDLYSLPHFEQYLFPNGTALLESESIAFDPVGIIWNTLRLGAPLCLLFNQLRPKNKLQVLEVLDSDAKSISNRKKCTYHFLVACKNELQIPELDLPGVSDIYKDDTNALVRVRFLSFYFLFPIYLYSLSICCLFFSFSFHLLLLNSFHINYVLFIYLFVVH